LAYHLQHTSNTHTQPIKIKKIKRYSQDNTFTALGILCPVAPVLRFPKAVGTVSTFHNNPIQPYSNPKWVLNK
jgi:hypothetical protein